MAEGTEVKPKPMVEIAGWPMLWQVLNILRRVGASGSTCGYRVSFNKTNTQLSFFQTRWTAERGARQLYDVFQ